MPAFIIKATTQGNNAVVNISLDCDQEFMIICLAKSIHELNRHDPEAIGQFMFGLLDISTELIRKTKDPKVKP